MSMGRNGEHAAMGLPPSMVDPHQGLLTWGWTETSEKAAVRLEYVGPTALVLTGPFTGQRYFFSRPGARLEVDIRDRAGLLAVPVLRPVVG